MSLIILKSQNPSHLKCHFKYKNKLLTYLELMKLSRTLQIKFYKLIQRVLHNSPYSQYLLEFAPVSWNTISTTILEFVLIPTRGLFQTSNINTYKEYGIDTINRSKDIIHFPNLSKDTLLICPCYNRKYNINSYSHIGSFFQSNNTKQQLNLLKYMFTVYAYILQYRPNKIYYMSTHGKGVAWLHIRIDSKPKYIQYYRR